MPKSATFKAVEKTITEVKAAQIEFLKAGKKDSLARSVKTHITSLIACVNKNESVLVETNEAGNILMLVINAFSAPDCSDILKTILDDLLPRVQNLSAKDKATIYTAKANGLSFLKLVATSCPDLLAIILPEICTWEDPAQILQTFTGMYDQSDLNTTPYSRSSIENLQLKLALLDTEQRVKLLTARDERNHNWNALAYAYAPTRKDSELMKALLQMPEVFEADPDFLSEPTDLPQVNANIFIYMLGQLNLLAQLQKLEGLSTLKKMLTARGDARKNALAIALETPVYSKLLGSLLALIQRLDIKDQRVVLNQLTAEEQTRLDTILGKCIQDNKEEVTSGQITAEEQNTLELKTACYQETTELLRALQQRPPKLFKAASNRAASAAADCLGEPEDVQRGRMN